ncbi:hypothetical protein LEN26_019720 [Aphanomyces euteiches]|nr:hypothetical protein LEN26_019720 [Aphanomyces euteiches]KAH9113558.1 hypothetical protein AeMF1_012265 [Aphanomyces euteiches]KAH9189753.1 hypothetical protein AeNC1_008277 [Aphanomyces euteiches]
MQGNGAYNKAAECQMSLVDYTTDLLKQAMARFAKHSTSKSTYNIVDLGASQGRNSLELLHHLIKHLDASLPENASPDILVLHEDQPANDFATLLDTLNSPQSYIHTRRNVYTGAISKSFYGQVVPSASVDIVVSYIAAHWLSKTPAPLPGSIVMINDPQAELILSPNVLATWKEAAHEDLVTFLRLRAAELVDNGSLCMTFISDDETPLVYEYSRRLRLGLEDMVNAGVLSSDSLDRAAIPAFMRTKQAFLAAVAEVPELELHEHQYVPMPVKFSSGAEAARFLSSVAMPSLEAGMTEEERKGPRMHEMFTTCMANRLSEPLAGASAPFFEQFTIIYFYCHLTRRERIKTSAP